MKNKFEKLILLEFLVHKVEFYENEFNFDKYFLARLGEICVQIKFKGCYILEIKEDENSRTECDETGKKTVFLGGGKSCLLSVSQLMNSANCEASICVSRKTPDGEPKEYFTFGEAKANLEPVFKVLQSSTKCGQPVKTMRGQFDLKDGQCTKIGSIELFVRATGLGKNIVTMFQLGAGESSFYFKGTEQVSEHDSDEEEESSCSVCKESRNELGDPSQSRRSRSESRPPCLRDPYYPYKEGTTYNQQFAQGSPWGAQPGYPPGFQPPQPFGQGMPSMGGGMGGMPAMGGGMGGMPTMGGGMGGMPAMGGAGGMAGAGGMGAMGGMGGPQMPGQPFPQAGGGQYFQPQGQYRDEDYEKLDGDYKEISAEVNGYEVKIKLLRRPKKVTSE